MLNLIPEILQRMDYPKKDPVINAMTSCCSHMQMICRMFIPLLIRSKERFVNRLKTFVTRNLTAKDQRVNPVRSIVLNSCHSMVAVTLILLKTFEDRGWLDG